MRPLLVFSEGSPVPQRLGTIAAEVARATGLPGPAEIDPGRPTAIVIDPVWRTAEPATFRSLAARAALVIEGAPGEATPPDGILGELSSAWLPAGGTKEAAVAILRNALRHADAVSAAHTRHDELSELTRIGVALSTERDLTVLLRLILSQARRLVSADAGSLYLVERTEQGPATMMRFALAQNHTLPDLPFREATVPLDSKSLAGYAAVSGQTLVVDDVYELPPDVPYRFNRSFDEKVRYRTQSVLVLPMKSHRDEVVGVLQLINRKRDADASLLGPEAVEAQVLPFDEHAVALVSALASQAAVAIENGRLYDDIARLFKGMVEASVHAIEQRDPTTAGHSFRVTAYTMGLADAINRGLGKGAYQETRFNAKDLNALQYACMLHDFGKVVVREAVLQKEKKLYPGDLAAVKHRFEYMLQAVDLASERERIEYLLAHGGSGYSAMSAEIDARRHQQREELHRILDAILRANEPSILAEEAVDELKTFTQRTFVGPGIPAQPLLTEEELRYLSIRRGNLDSRERQEIESHATQSHAFLTRIPWTREFRDIPDIVWGHHEKLNGKGYPRGIAADQLRLQTRMMTVADIFDALTAADRPYKRAVLPDRAIEILREEVRDGALDADLLDTFVDARVWEAVATEVKERTREARRTGISHPVTQIT
jgi:HD-GYP domain-containing protein (c-di-GMP phosphodiesterase class II)